MDIGKKLLKRVEGMQSVKDRILSTLEDISFYVMNERGDFSNTSSYRSPEVNEDIFDITAPNANDLLANSLAAGMTEGDFFTLSANDKDAKQNIPLKRELSGQVEKMLQQFKAPIGNFSGNNHACFLDGTSYGTGCLYVSEELKPFKHVNFQARHISEISIDENHSGSIDTVARTFKLTPANAVKKFKTGLSEDLIKRSKDPKRSEEKEEFVHLVMPTDDAEALGVNPKEAQGRSFVGFYLEKKKGSIISTEGFYEMPYVILRYSTYTGSIWGVSPAWRALPAIKMVNHIQEILIRASDDSLSGTMLMTDDGVLGPTEGDFGGYIVGGLADDGTPLIRPLERNNNIPVGLDLLERHQNQINEIYGIAHLIQKQGTPVSASEAVIDDRNTLRHRQPQVKRFEAEYFSQIIARVYGIMSRGNYFEETELTKEIQVSIQYISRFSQEQDSSRMGASLAAIQAMGPLLEANPTLLEVIDAEKEFRDNLVMSGANPENIRTSEEYAEIQAQKQAEQQQAQQAAQAQQGVETASKAQSAGLDVQGLISGDS